MGGALNKAGEPAFPNAEYFIAKAEWDFWFSEEAMLRPGKLFTDYARHALTPLAGKTTLLEREEEILPGVSVLFAPGHTPGHMVVSISSGNEQLLYTGDTVLHPLHLEHPDWVPVYDILPEPAAASKQRIFDLAAASGSWVSGQHFPPSPTWATSSSERSAGNGYPSRKTGSRTDLGTQTATRTHNQARAAGATALWLDSGRGSQRLKSENTDISPTWAFVNTNSRWRAKPDLRLGEPDIVALTEASCQSATEGRIVSLI